jgi:TatA/E family protein of Tat protein translocase
MIYNSIILFLNLGGGEVMLLLLVVLLLFGSNQLPQLVKGVAKGIREINDAKTQLALLQTEIAEIKKGVPQLIFIN